MSAGPFGQGHFFLRLLLPGESSYVVVFFSLCFGLEDSANV